MPPTATAPDRLRRLSAMRADRPVVLSLYLNLDPSEFATAPARESAVRSLVDEARKRIEAPDVDHEDRKGLRVALERAERFLERWCVVLVNRELGRVMLGDGRRLAAFADVEDDTHGQHDQGGWSQARYQRSVDKEVEEHLRSVAEVVNRTYDLGRFDHLLVGCPHELLNDFRAELLHRRRGAPRRGAERRRPHGRRGRRARGDAPGARGA